MTHIETARVNEVIGVQIGAVQAAAQRLRAAGAIEELEADIGALEKAIAELKGVLEALPHQHR